MNSDYVFLGKDFDCTYKQFVTNLTKDMGSDTMNALHAAVGISGEAGEIIDAVKKIWIYNKEPDSVYHTNILEELGDLNFYMQYLQNTYHITDEQIIEANIKKLQKRYKAGYSDEAAIARADKSEHVSDCSSNNAGVPELLGKCDCKEEQTATQRNNLQRIMNEAGDVLYFVSPKQMDAMNYKYCYGPFSGIELAEVFIKNKPERILTTINRGTINWSDWFLKAGWVPA